MVSKPSMVSDINIKKPSGSDQGAARSKQALLELDESATSVTHSKRGRLGGRSMARSSLARAIFLSNLVGLLILIIGALTLNEVRRGLINAKLQNLYSQAELISNILAQNATGDAVIAQLDETAALDTMRLLALPDGTRARLYNLDARRISDSDLLNPNVSEEELWPSDDLAEPGGLSFTEYVENGMKRLILMIPAVKERRARLRRNLDQDIRRALLGDVVIGEQYDQSGQLIVAVSVPVRRVNSVVGVVVLESNDVEAILDGERRALAPIIVLAFITSLLTSLALALFIALPVRRLARAAETVQRSSELRDAIPDLSGRRDEIGDLSLALREMTGGLYDRIDDIANFAADVAHEIKNPLTSLRSATETFEHAKTEAQREKLLAIIQNDVGRMDRLITDISKASRMDAELAREEGGPVDIEKMIADISEFYAQTRTADLAKVRYVSSDSAEPIAIIVRGAEMALGQVFRNLIDNALTFSPRDGEVRLRVREGRGIYEGLAVITVDDDGPGIPPGNLETIFERFYTERPKGTAFGSHSGLGLAICRQIIRAHRGSIRAENRHLPGTDKISGAKFTVTLPLYRA